MQKQTLSAQELELADRKALSSGMSVRSLSTGQRDFRNHFRAVFYTLQLAVYGTCFALGAYSQNNPGTFWEPWQANTIMSVAPLGILCILPWLFERASGVSFSLLADVLVAIDMAASLIFGEMLGFYSLVSGWDKILHFAGTAQLVLLGSTLARFYDRRNGRLTTKSPLPQLVFGLMFAITTEAIWEIYEWSQDTYALANMQKIIPDSLAGHIEPDGSIATTVTDEQLASFYRSRAGYSYAVQDTVLDLIVDVAGGLAGLSLLGFAFSRKPEWADGLMFVDPYSKAIWLKRRDAKAKKRVNRKTWSKERR